MARKVGDIVNLKCSSSPETDNSISRKELPVEIKVIDKYYYIVAINYERKYTYGT